jgi:hypothetical protein
MAIRSLSCCAAALLFVLYTPLHAQGVGGLGGAVGGAVGGVGAAVGGAAGGAGAAVGGAGAAAGGAVGGVGAAVGGVGGAAGGAVGGAGAAVGGAVGGAGAAVGGAAGGVGAAVGGGVGGVGGAVGGVGGTGGGSGSIGASGNGSGVGLGTAAPASAQSPFGNSFGTIPDAGGGDIDGLLGFRGWNAVARESVIAHFNSLTTIEKQLVLGRCQNVIRRTIRVSRAVADICMVVAAR